MDEVLREIPNERSESIAIPNQPRWTDFWSRLKVGWGQDIARKKSYTGGGLELVFPHHSSR
jgi:fructosamine-3-kinase